MAIAGCLLAALLAGTMTDVPKPRVSLELSGYHVLAADLHVHSFPFSWSTLSPWDTVIDARYQGLDVVALTPHNHVWVGKVGWWFSRLAGDPIVIVGEEIASRRYHMLAVGISDTVDPGLPAARAIEEVHRQGGVAIAAHPYEQFQREYDAEALQTLDGTEVVRPEAQHDERSASALREFYHRAKVAAIGSSDFHGPGPLGYSRTYIFARERTKQSVLDAIREGRTVVYDRERVFGDPEMIALASSVGGFPRDLPAVPVSQPLAVFSSLAGLFGLAGLLVFNRW
jgi:hypothetical protein